MGTYSRITHFALINSLIIFLGALSTNQLLAQPKKKSNIVQQTNQMKEPSAEQIAVENSLISYTGGFFILKDRKLV